MRTEEGKDIQYWNGHYSNFTNDDEGTDIPPYETITHWQPLPEPPKE